MSAATALDPRIFGTVARGSRVRGAKLRDEQINAIREARAYAVSCSYLAWEYGVTKQTISHIATRRTWKHL